MTEPHVDPDPVDLATLADLARKNAVTARQQGERLDGVLDELREVVSEMRQRMSNG